MRQHVGGGKPVFWYVQGRRLNNFVALFGFVSCTPFVFSVGGKANPVADALSRSQFQRFRLLATMAER